MTVGREQHTATLLPDGSVLFAGGHLTIDLAATAEIFDPHLFLVDKEPWGMRGEVRETLFLLKERGTRLVLGLRDVMDEPRSLMHEWRRKNVLPALRNVYDEIWVYGLPEIFNPLTELPGMRVPTVAEEAARDLVRARGDAGTDLMRARHRLSKLLLRHGRVFEGAAWTRAHDRWLGQPRWDQAGLRVAYDEAYGTVLAIQARRDRLEAAIAELAATPTWAPLVGRLGCLRGIGS